MSKKKKGKNRTQLTERDIQGLVVFVLFSCIIYIRGFSIDANIWHFQSCIQRGYQRRDITLPARISATATVNHQNRIKKLDWVIKGINYVPRVFSVSNMAVEGLLPCCRHIRKQEDTEDKVVKGLCYVSAMYAQLRGKNQASWGQRNKMFGRKASRNTKLIDISKMPLTY